MMQWYRRPEWNLPMPFSRKSVIRVKVMSDNEKVAEFSLASVPVLTCLAFVRRISFLLVYCSQVPCRETKIVLEWQYRTLLKDQ
jgi:hypothetical protein